MKIENRPIEELKEAHYNPRKISEKQMEDLKTSLTKYGIQEPVIINSHEGRENIIIGGHQRTRAWRELGNTEIPCVVLNLEEKDEKELNTRLNKNGGEFDMSMLKAHFEDDELLKYGFEDFELGIVEEIDYSLLEELDDDTDSMMSEMEGNVNKAIQIEFEEEDYEEAQRLNKHWREQGANVGQMLLEAMREAKETL